MSIILYLKNSVLKGSKALIHSFSFQTLTSRNNFLNFPSITSNQVHVNFPQIFLKNVREWL